jgi:hypothetical protein
MKTNLLTSLETDEDEEVAEGGGGDWREERSPHGFDILR